MKVALSILTADFSNVEKSVGEVMRNTDYVHMDIMDGVFVPNISIGYSVVKALRKMTDKPFDTHLMIIDPIHYIEQFASAGSQYITFHVEAKSPIMETIDKIHTCGCKAGLSIKPNTKVEEIEQYLPFLDMVLVMSVEPGFGGQSFMPNAIEKVKLLKELREKNNYHYLINIDGGINAKTAPLVKDYVDMAVSGSYVCNAEDQMANLKFLQNL